MKGLQLLKERFTLFFDWNQARITFMAQFVLALLDAQTCNLNTLAQKFRGRAMVSSHYRRIRRFFRDYCLDFDFFAKAIAAMMPIGSEWLLCLDRTNWKFGKKNINILVLGVAYKGVCIPLLWTLLNKRGCSNTHERICLIQHFLRVFGPEVIYTLTADREFIGQEWIQWLKDQKIHFRIRIRNNTKMRSARGNRMVHARTLFRGLSIGKVMVLKNTRRVWGVELYIVGLRTKDDYVILVTAEAPGSAMEDYKRRWEIEMLFSCLKKRGFDFESTHLAEAERVSKLMALLTLAFCWCLLQGEFLNQGKEIKLKKHGYPAKSLFRTGLESLTNLIANISCKYKDFRHATKFFVL